MQNTEKQAQGRPQYSIVPVSPMEAGFFYAQTPEEDSNGVPIETQRSGFDGERRKERSRAEFSPSGGNGAGGVSSDEGAIGHVRIDFGHGGDEFWHTWWPRGPEALHTREFKAELGQVMDELRRIVLKDLPSMRRCCREHGGEIGGGICTQNYGFTVETDRYHYRLRCNPIEGNYQAYLSCFDKQAQKQIIGRVSFANGEQFEYTDPAEYLKVIQEELPCGL